MTASSRGYSLRGVVMAVVVVLSGCGSDWGPKYRCVGGILYRQDVRGEPWRAVDAAPTHGGFTPQPCFTEPN